MAFKKRPTNGFFDPNIAIGGEKVPYGGDNEIKFLGLPVDLDLSVSKCQELLLQRLRVFCERVDTLPLKSVQKLKIYKLCICPRLSWLRSVQEYPFSCIERHLEPIATSYLKKWCHISRCANTSCLYLPSTNLGLNMPSISSLYKSLQIGRYYHLLSSTDNRVQRLADSKCLREKGDTRHKFRSSSATASILKDLAKVSSQKMKSHLKSHVQSADATRRLQYLKSCPIQGSLQRLPSFHGEVIWANVLSHLNDKVLSFAINAVQDVLSHNVNLHRWHKEDSKACPLCGQNQTLMHVLNNCKASLHSNRYTWRHNSVLGVIAAFVKCSLQNHGE